MQLHEPAIITIFGALGDLSKRKLLPALFNLWHEKMLPEQFYILGLGRGSNLDGFVEYARASLNEFSRRGVPTEEEWTQFSAHLRYLDGSFEDPTLHAAISTETSELMKGTSVPWVRMFYLSTPPSLIEVIAQQLHAAGLSGPKDRLVIEKPFGRDLESATKLNTSLLNYFDEDRIFRIDHYLGKETVQNILAFRFANAMYEPIWKRGYIDHVQITVSEEVGVETRGKFYESAGALRDMIQNHLLQLLCMVAMEPPISLDADEVRNKKVDVLKALRPIPPDELYRFVVRGQYGPGYVKGQVVKGYRQEDNVDPNSSTETFIALKLYVDNWRWQDVPFYLRTGKRMAAKASKISIQFRPVPHQMFPEKTSDHWEPNRLTINIQPEEGITVRIQAKQPGQKMKLRTVNMDFDYDLSFTAEPPEAYETLLYDVLEADGTLFMRSDQEHYAWSVVTPILEAWENSPSQDFPNYAAGSWGPEAAEALIARDGRSWHAIPVIFPPAT